MNDLLLPTKGFVIYQILYIATALDVGSSDFPYNLPFLTSYWEHTVTKAYVIYDKGDFRQGKYHIK